MLIEIKIDNSCKEPKIVLITDKVTDEMNEIIKRLSDSTSQILCGFKEEEVKILEQDSLISVYSNAGKIYAVTNQDEYLLKLRLYEVEQRLNSKYFVRISNSEIINLKNARSFDLSFVGTICVTLSNDTTTYVSRRYVSKIKQVLGIGGDKK